MKNYALCVMLLHTGVQFLLILGAARLCGYAQEYCRSLLCAIAAGLYAGICLLPRFLFLAAFPFRLCWLILMIWLAFGVNLLALRCGAIFMLLNMALEGLAIGTHIGQFAIVILGLLCVAGFWGTRGGNRYIPLQLCYQGKKMSLTALRDTGNQLKDPLTGRPVLVVCPDVARQMTGLSCQQLQRPLESILSANVPGLQLVPYRSIGKKGDFLLAVRMQIRIGNRREDRLVAFAPNGFGEDDYQALTGGII